MLPAAEHATALGLGLSVGPLLGALLGSISWCGPFLGTAILMAVALILCATFLAGDSRQERPKIGLLEPLKALKHPVLLRTSIGAALYTAAFFIVSGLVSGLRRLQLPALARWCAGGDVREPPGAAVRRGGGAVFRGRWAADVQPGLHKGRSVRGCPRG